MIRRDRKRVFRYASLQSETGKKLTNEYEIPTEIDSIILLHKGKWYIKSDVVFIVIKELKWYWRMFEIVKILPRRLLDRLYDWVATHRYKIFGKRDTCRVPTEEEREMFL